MTAISRFIHRYAPWVVGVWFVVAVGANSVVPLLENVAATHDQPFLPSDTGTSVAVQRSAAAFSQDPNSNVGYLVLERNGPLEDRDRAFYDQLIAALRSDPHHVIQVVDWWAVPVVSGAALSSDRNVVTATVRLAGILGTSQASASITAARGIVKQMQPPDGLHIYVTGPSATVMDEFAATDKQTIAITATTVAVVLVLLLLIYRSVITAMVPLLSVSLALAVTRPIVAALGASNLIGVSMFSVALSTAVVLAAGINFAVFLIGRYHERRRQKVESAAAFADAYRGVAPVVVGSALAVATAMVCLSLIRISMFRTTGVACAIGVLIAGLAALTLTPALIALGDRADLFKPRRRGIARPWRRIGVTVARWPGPILVGSSAVLFVLAISMHGIWIGWDEAAATPAKAESNRGYHAVNHHFPPNQLLPDAVTIETDHDIRNPDGLIAVEQITGAIMALPGVEMVQSASRPNGTVPRQGTVNGQMGNISDRLDEAYDQLASRQAKSTDLDAALRQMTTALDGFQTSVQQGTGLSSAGGQLQAASTVLRTSINDLSDTLDPLRGFITETPDCRANPLCASVQDVLQWASTVVDSSARLANAAGMLATGATDFGAALAGLPYGLGAAGGGAQGAAAGLKDMVNNIGSPMRELSGFMRELAAVFHGSPGAGYYVSPNALADPSMRYVLDSFISPDGHATLLLVYGDEHEWGDDGAQRSRIIEDTVRGSMKDGTLKPTSIQLAGVGPTTRDLEALLRGAMPPLVATTLAIMLVIVGLLLQSPVAGLVVVGTAAVSYLSALGASVLIWQHIIGHALHWSVLPIAFYPSVAVGCAYNLLLALRVREELPGGPRISIIRALAATGGVVTIGGIVFAATMFALATSSVLSVAQIGVTVGIGVVLNVVVVRAFALPAFMVLLGSGFWWPGGLVGNRRVPERWTSR